jgi:hypothetical protein
MDRIIEQEWPYRLVLQSGQVCSDQVAGKVSQAILSDYRSVSGEAAASGAHHLRKGWP